MKSMKTYAVILNASVSLKVLNLETVGKNFFSNYSFLFTFISVSQQLIDNLEKKDVE